MDKCHLIAGCKGRIVNGVMLCGGTSYSIIDMATVDPSDSAFYNYIFQIMKIDKFPITDYNSVLNTIYFLQDYISSQKYSIITEWIRLHKNCGVYIYRDVERDYYHE